MNRTARARVLVRVALAGVFLLASAASSPAQDRCDCSPREASGERTLRLDARGGIAFPTADMRDYVDEGPVLGAGLAHRFEERLSARVDWQAALMRPADRTSLIDKGADVPPRGSETDLHHLTGGLQVRLSDPRRDDIELRAHGGAGVTFLSTEETELAEGGDFTQFTLDVGLELAVPLSPRVRFVGRGDVYMLPFRAGAPAHLLKEVIVPFSGGLAVGL